MTTTGHSTRTRRARRTRLLTAASVLALGAGLAATSVPSGALAAEPTWSRVGTGMTGGVSGLAPLGSQDWLMVRDNKNEGQNRLAVLRAGGQVEELSWPGADPVDLEAVAAVPGVAGRFAAVTSAGTGHLVDVVGTTVDVGRAFTLPAGRNQDEGFALTRLGTTTVAVWGKRGSSTTAGRVFTATFDPATGGFGAVSSRPVSVPYPTRSVRHVSDVAVVDGRVVVSSASDPGVDGPFASAVYDVSTVSLSSGRARLSVPAVREVARLADHKVEGLACRGAVGLLGSDDERGGGWVADAPAGICG